MEEAAQKMAALKKVYADIILNLAKESAARVQASNRRALLSHQSLVAAKEEAVATLIRVKSMMDAKIKEAETASLGQLRKIEELEAQLNEAEDTVCSLREELHRANYELAKVKNNLAEPSSGHPTKCQERKDSPDSVLCYPGVPEHVTAQQRRDNESVGNADLASIIMRRKEPELYRNGCTQRIRALEQNILTASDGQSLDLKSATVSCENGRVRRPCSIDPILRFPRRARRKQRGRHNPVKPTNLGTIPGQYVTDNEPSNTGRNSGRLECSKTSTSVENITGKSNSDPQDHISEIPPSDLLIKLAENNAGNAPQGQVSVLLAPDQKATENLHSLSCTPDPDTNGAPIMISEIKDEKNCVSSGTAQAGRFLKYTFQRKRKRGCADNKEESSLDVEKSALKSSGDKQNALRESQNPSLVVELPRKDRRVAQVARQLISLSESRW